MTVAAGRLAVVIVSGCAFTVIDSAWLAYAPTMSVALAVKFEVPAVVGVPVIAPVDELSDSPAGRFPE